MLTNHTAIDNFSVLTDTGITAAIPSIVRRKVRGAPGLSSSLSTLGKPFGGEMLPGVAVAAGAGVLVRLLVYCDISEPAGLTGTAPPLPGLSPLYDASFLRRTAQEL